METVRKTFFSGFVKKYGLLIWSFLTAAIVLAVCSKSSFLYPFNDWVDANCYFTVGKGMVSGLVPYRDLVEQKGVLIYFLHGLAYLVSHTTFLGVYFLEVVAGTVYLYYAAKTAALFVHERWGYVIAPVLAALVYSSASFAHGDSAEEVCLPLLMLGVYGLARFFKNKEDLSARMIVLCGAAAGCVLWIKLTMLGFWAGWMLAVFVGLLLARQPRKAFAACMWFLLGMAAATLPWLVYFAANGAVSDWFRVYFYLNFTAYPKTHGLTEMLSSTWSAVYANVKESPVLLVSMIIGVLGFVCTNKMVKGAWAKVCFVLVPTLLAFGVYCGGRAYPYYFLILTGLLMLPGLIVLARSVSGLAQAVTRWRVHPSQQAAARTGVRMTTARTGVRVAAHTGVRMAARTGVRMAARTGVRALPCAAVLALSVLGAYRSCQYRDFMEQDREELAQYRFAEIMNGEDDPTLLNYGFLDGGFYTAADILPTVKYFCKLNLDLPEMIEAQREAIRDRAVDFVVLRCKGRQKEYGSDVPYLLDNYELAETVRQEFEGIDFTYCLFRVKG